MLTSSVATEVVTMNDLFDDFEEAEEFDDDIEAFDDETENPRQRILPIVGIIVIVILCLALGGLGWVNRDKVTAMFDGNDEPTTENVEEGAATAVPDDAVEDTENTVMDEDVTEDTPATAVVDPTATTEETTEASPTSTPLACISYVRTYTTSNIRSEPLLDSDNVLMRTESRQVLCVVEEQLWPEEWYRVEYESGEYGWIGSTQVQACFSQENC